MSLIADEEDELYRKRGIGPLSTPLGDKADAYLREEKQKKEREDAARQEKLKAARYSTYSALDTKPDEYAQARALGAQAGVSPEAAMDYPNELKRQARMKSIDFGALPPTTLKALASSVFAMTAHDDIEVLSGMERSLRALGKIGKATASSVPRANASLWGLGSALLERLPFGLGEQGATQFRALANKQEAIATSLMPDSDGILGRGFYSGVASIPDAAVALGLGLVNPAIGLAYIGLLSGGTAYNQARNKGLAPDQALTYASSQGVIEAASEKIGLKWLLKDLAQKSGFLKTLTHQVLAEIPSEQVATVLQDLNEWAVLRPEATLKDYLEERPRAAAETLVATVTATAGLVGGVHGIRRVIDSAQQQASQVRQAEVEEVHLQEIEKIVQQSALRQRAPDEFANFVKEVAESDGVDTPYVFIDAQKLAQSPSAPKLAEMSPSVAQQLPNAVENGGDVRIPMEEYLTHLSGTEAITAVRDDLKLSPEGLSFGQAKKLREQESVARAKEDAKQGVEQLLNGYEHNRKQAQLKEVEEIESSVLKQLKEVGHFSDDVAKAYSKLPAAFFSTIADRIGVSPLELYRQHEADITGQPVIDKRSPLEGISDNLGEFRPQYFGGQEKNAMYILRAADLSTFLHESGHWFLDAYSQIARTHDALKADMDVLLKWFGVKDLETWNAMSLDQQRESHERFARGFEAYLMEGRAPSAQMQSLFDRFKAWLKRVYIDITDLDVTLNDEVRGVMDRMLATDEQIEQAQHIRGLAPLFATPEAAQAHNVDWQSYTQAQQEATETSRSTLDERRIADMTWANQLREKTIKRFNKDALEKRKEVKAEVEAELSTKPIYQAIRFLRDGEITRDGEEIKVEQGHKIDLKTVSAMFPANALTSVNWKSLGVGKRGMLAEGGLAPDMVAEIFGFSSGEAMIREIVETAPFKKAVDELTNQRMFEKFGDITSDEALGRAADEAIFNDVRARFIAGELAALKNALGGERLLQTMAKDRAKSIVDNTRVKDLKLVHHNSAMAAARAGKAAEQAFKEQNIAQAAEQKRKQLIQLEAAKLAAEARTDAKETLGFFRNIVQRPDARFAKTRSMEIVNVARAILAEYGLDNKRIDIGSRIESLKEYSPEVYAALEAKIDDARYGAKPFNELTSAELGALKDVVESLWEVSRREKLLEIDGKKVEKEAAVERLLLALAAHPAPERKAGINYTPGRADRAKRMLQGLRAAHRRVESWVDNLDNGDIKGAIRTYIFNPISAASDRMRTQQAKTMKEVEALLKKVSGTFIKAKIEAPELKFTFGNNGGVGHVDLLGAILHTGNNSNKEKLLINRGWGTYREDGSLDTSRWDGFIQRMIAEGKLTKEHFDFAQGVWDLLESLKPEAQKAYRTIYGTYFDEITAKEFETPFGTYRGGYYPAVADPFISQKTEQQNTMNSVTEGADYMFPVTPRGFTKSRVKTTDRPLAMDLRLIGQHVNKVLLFSNLSVPVRDVLSLLRDNDVHKKLNQLDPVAYNDLLLPWLNRAAKQIVETPVTGEGGKLGSMVFRVIRRNTGLSQMAANVINAAQNITSAPAVLTKIETFYVARALFDCLTDYKRIQRAISEGSEFMENRFDSTTHIIGQEIEKILINPNKFQQGWRFVRTHAYFLQQVTQNAVDTVAWHAAYNQALNKGLDEEMAVREADSFIRQTQGSLNPEDVSRIETGTAFARVFTQYTSYFNMISNLVVTEAAKITRSDLSVAAKAQKLGGLYMKAIAVPTALSMLVYATLKGGWRDEDDWLNGFLKAYIGDHFSFLGPLGTVLNSIYQVTFNKKHAFENKLNIAPVVGAFDTARRSFRSVYDAISGEGKASSAIKDAGVAASILFGPVKPFTDRIGYGVGVELDEIEPKGTADYVRGLITGRAAP